MCAHSGCTAPPHNNHTKWCLDHKDACCVIGCTNSTRGAKICSTHRRRQDKYGTTEKPQRRPTQRARPHQLTILLSNSEKHYTQGEAKAVDMSMAQYLRLLLQNDMSKQGRA